MCGLRAFLKRPCDSHVLSRNLGFECTPSYIEVIRPKDYAAILRNLIVVSALLNTVLCFLACALLPVGTIVGGANVLSALGGLAGGRWLRILVSIDAVSVLLGGVMTGTVTTIQLLDRMAQSVSPPNVRYMPIQSFC